MKLEMSIFSFYLILLVLNLHEKNSFLCFDLSNSNQSPSSITHTTTIRLPQTKAFASKSSLNITLNGHNDWVLCVIVLNNGDLASGGKDKKIIIWDSVTYGIKRWLSGHNGDVSALASLSNDDLISGSADTTIKIWNPNFGSVKNTLIGHTGLIRSLALLNNNTLASGSLDQTIKIWDLRYGQLKSTIRANGEVHCLTVLPNGYLASGQTNGEIRIFDPIIGNTLKHSFRPCISNSRVAALKSMNSGELASTCFNFDLNTFAIQTWNSISFLSKANYTGHSSLVNDIVELPNGDLASASDDRTIKIWDRNTGEMKKTLRHHFNSVLALAVLKNGLLASGSADTTIVISGE
jgi:WD40 repeat protein